MKAILIIHLFKIIIIIYYKTNTVFIIKMEEARETKLFKTNKESTNEFFKKSKVGSCSHVIVKNGVSIAIPFQITTAKGTKLGSYKTTETASSQTKSIYR